MVSEPQKSALVAGKETEPVRIWQEPRLCGGALLLLTLLVYIPSYKAGFIWDDDIIAGHPLMKDGWRGLRDIWFSIRFGDFCPITATSFWIEWQIHGGLKEIQHATNVVLQALNVVLLWRVVLKLRIPGAWLIAAVFAVHPVCVASVTWLAERKNTLSMFFYLLSLLFYLRAETRVEPTAVTRFDKRSYWLSFAFFILGLLSKSSVVVLPVVFLLCAWWRDGRLDRRAIWRVMPFVAFSFAAGITTLVAHFYFGPKLGVLPTHDSALVRLLTAARAFWFYLDKDLLPIGLTMHYPRWKIGPLSLWDYLPAIALVATLAICWRFRRMWGKCCLFGLGYFLVAVAPTIGVVNMAFLMMAPVADHLQYLAIPGIIAFAVGGATFVLHRAMHVGPAARLLFSILLLSPLAALSWQRQMIMSRPEALWRDNLNKNPVSWISHNNLGGIFFERGQFEQALHSYEAALRERNNLSMVHVNVGRALFALGRTEEAITRYNDAIALDATDFKAYNNLGVALISLGRTNEAIVAFQNAVRLVPGEPTFFANLARLLVDTGQTERVIHVFRDRLKRVPRDANVHYQLGSLLFAKGEAAEALLHYEAAVNLAPAFVEARFALAELLARQNRKADAINQWRQILKVQPDAIQVLANLAWALATDPNERIRNGDEAVRLAQQVCALAGQSNGLYLDLLAAALAEVGQFDRAIKSEEEAAALAAAAGNTELAGKFQARLKLYRARQPFRVP